MKIRIGGTYWCEKKNPQFRCEIELPAFVFVVLNEAGDFLIRDLKNLKKEGWVKEENLSLHPDPSIADEIEVLENRLLELRAPHKPRTGEIWNIGEYGYFICCAYGMVSLANGETWCTNEPSHDWSFVGLPSKILSVEE